MSQLQVTGEAKIRDIQGPVIANSGVITALDGAASQYVRGDGTLADFPTSTGGGSSVSYYLNSSVSQGTIGGVAYRELSKEPIIGAGTDITISANGYVANYITDANDPDVLSVPGGNFNCEFYFSVNNNTGNPTTYAELYKYDGTTFTLLGSSVGVPESINQGTTIAPYYFAIPVATAALALTDRLAIRIYVNVDGRTVTLHTENSHLCQVVTTFSKGMVSLNNLTDQSQFITTGTSGTDFNIVSTGDTHTFNLPVASATNTGKLSNTDWSTFNAKQAALSFTAPLVNTSNTISIPAATSLVDGYLDNLDWVNFNTAYNDSIVSAAVTGTTTKTLTLNQQDGGTITASWTDINTDAVTSVFGRTGAVVAQSGDYTTTQVTEGTNLYYTDARSRGALSFTAGSGAYNSTTGVITIPTNNNQITNGAGYITSSALTSYVPYTGATTNVDLGTNSISSSFIYGNGVSGLAGSIYLKQTTSIQDSSSGYSSMSAFGASSLHFSLNNGTLNRRFRINSVNLDGTNIRTYLLPDADGTIALTSDLSAYVTLATTQTISGLKTFDAAISANYGIALLNGAIPPLTSIYYAALSGNSTGLSITYRTGGGTNYTNNLNFPANNNSYLFPSASGTLALTSNLSAYLPLTGGTLTGALSGTSATFTNTSTFRATGNAYTNGSIILQSSSGATSTYLTNSGGIFYLSNNGSTDHLQIASTGAAIFSSSVSARSGLTGTITAITTNDASGFGVGLGYVSGSYGYVTSQSASSPLVLAIDGGERMRITSGGDVAIGDTSASANLWVKNSGAGNTFGARNTNASFAATIGFFGADRNTTNNSFYYIDCYNYGSGTYRFRVADSGAVTAGTLSRIGDVFIGGRSGTYASYTDGVFGDNLHLGATATGGAVYINTALSRNLIINPVGGNVGIGTSSPANILTVQANDTFNQDSSGQIVIRGASNTAKRLGIGFDTTNNYAYLQAIEAGVATRPLVLQPFGGNVGIGTTGASNVRLYVKGSDTTSSNFSLYSTDTNDNILIASRNDGIIYTGTRTLSPYNYSTSGRSMVIENTGALGYLVSTRESKGNIQSIKSIDFISQLNPVQFNYRKKDKTNNTFTNELYENITYGFIAEEVEKVNKELVFYNNDNTLAGVEYNSMIAILTKSVQELKAEIEELKALINK